MKKEAILPLLLVTSISFETIAKEAFGAIDKARIADSTVTMVKLDAAVINAINSGGSGDGTADSLDLKANFGAVGDGVADDTDEIQAAMDSGAKIIVPPGVYLISGALKMNVITTIFEGVNATFKSTATRVINVFAGTSITGIKFEKVYLYFRQNHQNPGKFIVDRCSFLNGDYAIRGQVGRAGVGIEGEMPHNVQVTNCVFDNCSYGISGAFSDSVFSKNKMTNSPNRNIELNAGSDNLISHNWIDSGVTGICLMMSNSYTQRKPINRNIITNNRVSNISEEAISLDIHGDTAADSGSRITGTVSSIDASRSARIVPSFTLAANAYTHYYVQFLTGRARGQTHLITGMGAGGTRYLEIPTADKNLIGVSDKFTVHIGCVGNVIANNIVKKAQTGITAYGTGTETIIEGNHVEDCTGTGILIRSLYNVQAGGYGIVSNSLVQGNVVVNCELAADIISFGSSPIDVLSVGNKFQDNNVINGHIIYEYQYDDHLLIGNTATGSNENTPTTPADVFYFSSGVPFRRTKAVTGGKPTWAHATLAYDLFTGANSATKLGAADAGGSWKAVDGTWGISSNEAYSVSDVPGNIAVLPAVGTGNYIVSCVMKGDIDSSANRRRPALLFRYVDSSNFMLAYLEEGRVVIGKSDGGKTSVLASYPHLTVDNTWYSFKVICKDDIVKLSVNGVWVASHILEPAEYKKYGSAGQVGMRLSKSGSPSVAARWNNLIVEPLS